MGKRAANPATVEALRILRKARKLIESGEQSFVCLAIRCAGNWSHFSASMARRVMDSISPFFTFGDWAEHHGHPYDPVSMRLTYLDAWIAKHEQAIARQQRGAS